MKILFDFFSTKAEFQVLAACSWESWIWNVTKKFVEHGNMSYFQLRTMLSGRAVQEHV